jgi:DNA polymerase (family 10)
VREIVRTGTLGKLEKLRSQSPPELVGLSEYPRLDPKRVLRAYKKLGISSVHELRAKLEDKLNSRSDGVRVLKSAEVDIPADGTLDYPDDLLKELDYTVCSVHSRFGLGKEQQTGRILRAMDNRYFNILGHATGRLILKRPGYELDMERVVRHARRNGCFFEINSSPDRLDLSAENARLANEAGVKIAISTLEPLFRR